MKLDIIEAIKAYYADKNIDNLFDNIGIYSDEIKEKICDILTRLTEVINFKWQWQIWNYPDKLRAFEALCWNDKLKWWNNAVDGTARNWELDKLIKDILILQEHKGE